VINHQIVPLPICPDLIAAHPAPNLLAAFGVVAGMALSDHTASHAILECPNSLLLVAMLRTLVDPNTGPGRAMNGDYGSFILVAVLAARPSSSRRDNVNITIRDDVS
jgi:hypothetical protein